MLEYAPVYANSNDPVADALFRLPQPAPLGQQAGGGAQPVDGPGDGLPVVRSTSTCGLAPVPLEIDAALT